MSRPRLAALTLSALLAIGSLAPPLAGALDAWAELLRVVARARELQTPERALVVWGAPKRRFGDTDLRPLLAYDPERRPIETVELKYRVRETNKQAAGPAPKRLEYIDVSIWSPEIREETLRGWFGPPASIEKDREKLGADGAVWVYGLKDRADLGVIQVTFATATAERARSLSGASAQGVTPTIVIRLDGAPRPGPRPPETR